MSGVYIMGAGYSFNLQNKEYKAIENFRHKLEFLGIKTEIALSCYGTTDDLYAQYINVESNFDCIVIVDEMATKKNDVGKAMLVDYFGARLIEDKSVFKEISQICEINGVAITDSLKRLAYIPEVSTIISNPIELVPGFSFFSNNHLFFILPHKSEELLYMLENAVMPALFSRYFGNTSTTSFAVFNIDIHQLEIEIMNIKNSVNIPVEFRYYQNDENVEVVVTAYAESEEHAKQLANDVAWRVTDILWPNAIISNGEEFDYMLLSPILNKNIPIAAALACGTMNKELSDRLKNVFLYIVNATSLEVREKVLEVPRQYMSNNNGINEQSSRQMAHSISEIYNTDLGFSLIKNREENRASIGVATTSFAKSKVFSLPEKLSEKQYATYLCHYILRYLDRTIVSFAEGVTHSAPELKISNSQKKIKGWLAKIR